MLLLIIAIAMFQMLSQGPGCWGWGGTAGHADSSPCPLIPVGYLEQEGRETVLAIVPTLVLVLIRTVSLIGISLGGRNISPKLELLFKEVQTVSFPPSSSRASVLRVPFGG